MKASFIIPVFGNLEITEACIKSLQLTVSLSDYEILIVDDGSDLKTREGLEALQNDKIQVIRNATNSGYSHSNNVGARAASGEILFLINNDLEFLPGWFEPMLAAFDKFDNLGIIGNIQLNAVTEKVDHCGQGLTVDANLVHIQKKNTLFPILFPYTNVDAITAACCAIKKSVYSDIGEFDESFLNGCEDIDLCFRLKARNYKILVSNQSEVKHLVSATRREATLNNEQNFRLLQRRWSTHIAELTSLSWPAKYLSKCVNDPRYLSFRKLCDALPRYFRLIKTPSPTGLIIARSRMLHRLRHWRKGIDGLSDEQIEAKERETNTPQILGLYDYKGLFDSEEKSTGPWIREYATIKIPKGLVIDSITIQGYIREATFGNKEEYGSLGLKTIVNDAESRIFWDLENGKFEIQLDSLPYLLEKDTILELHLLGVTRTNTYAFLGRIFEGRPYIPEKLKSYFSKFRPQKKNKRLSITAIELNQEAVFDFTLFPPRPTSPINEGFLKKYRTTGVNLVGWFEAELGIGESARLAAKAIKHSGLKHALVPLKVNCNASQNDKTYSDELSEENPHPINIFHIDTAQSLDIDHHHGKAFRERCYNIAYLAWELPEFPNNWIRFLEPFDEIWTPSNFVRDSIAAKSPLPVLTVPHCIQFERPTQQIRQRFKLPEDKFLFEFVYDLNSYQERKNPQATINAFKKAFAGTPYENEVGLVIKTHSIDKNREAYELLKAELKGIENHFIVDETLSRKDVYELINCCDAYVSLHRSEGFGLTLAEAMFLGKPVISTNWSATSEFIDEQNGYPVDFQLKVLEMNFGPYHAGQTWADPDVDHAAAQMLKVFQNPANAQTLGEKAAQTISERFSPERIGQLYEKRLNTIMHWHTQKLKRF